MRPSSIADDLTQDAVELVGHLLGRLEAVVGIGRGARQQELVQRVVALEHRNRFPRRKREAEVALVSAEVEAQHRERAGDREQVRRDRRTGGGDLGRLVADRAEHGRRRVVHAVDAAEVDQLERMLRLDDVVDLEVAEQQPEAMQVAERGQDLEHVRDRHRRRERVGLAAVRVAARGEDLLEAQPADVLHHDVAGALVLDEVEDLHDVRMLDLGQEAALGQRGGHRVVVARVEQSLEHDPAVGHVAVPGEVDPPHAAVGDGADHLVLAGDDDAGAELGLERERRPALAAEPRRAPGRAVAAASDRLLATGAETAALGHDGGRPENGVRRIAERHRFDLDQPGPEVCSRARARPAGRRSS